MPFRKEPRGVEEWAKKSKRGALDWMKNVEQINGKPIKEKMLNPTAKKQSRSERTNTKKAGVINGRTS